MEERPILFSSEMVKAILDGRKTQTRRVVKPQPELIAGDWFYRKRNMSYSMPNQGELETELLGIWDACPYGFVGGQLWVRETWKAEAHPLAGARIRYLAGGEKDVTGIAKDNPSIKYTHKHGWRPSIHMPRWASRITLVITGVRVERAQDISEDDAEAEGIHLLGLPKEERYSHPRKHIVAFQALWDLINQKRGYSWASNPWVWVIEFKVEVNNG